jgi:diadenylate cyclase
VVVVSEETGIISVAYNGRMVRRLDANRLRNVLLAFFQHRLGGRGWTKRI